jgi:hypothetical protein
MYKEKSRSLVEETNMANGGIYTSNKIETALEPPEPPAGVPDFPEPRFQMVCLIM